jgi:hypothetical protein
MVVMGGPWRAFRARYQAWLRDYPVLTNMVQSFLLWTLGNALSQIYESYTSLASASLTQSEVLDQMEILDSKENLQNSSLVDMRRGIYKMELGVLSAYLSNQLYRFDFSRSITSGLYGGLFLGPVGNLWYKGLDFSVTKMLNPKTLPFLFLLTKVLLDICIFGPVHVTVYFTWMKIAKGATLDEVKSKLIEDFLPTLIADSVYWIPIQILNFRFVPVPLQLTVVNVACIFECAGLSFLSQVGWGHVQEAHM